MEDVNKDTNVSNFSFAKECGKMIALKQFKSGGKIAYKNDCLYVRGYQILNGSGVPKIVSHHGAIACANYMENEVSEALVLVKLIKTGCDDMKTRGECVTRVGRTRDMAKALEDYIGAGEVDTQDWIKSQT